MTTMYHESEARRNIRDLEEEQRQEGLRREAFSYEDFLSRVDDAVGPLEGWRGDQSLFPKTAELLDKYRDLYNGPTFEETAREIYDECFNLLVQRQVKYGSSNIEQQGLYGVLVRIRDDKISRIQRALNGRVEHGQVVLDDIDMTGEEGDTLEDAYKDLANYAVISLMLLRGVWGRPLAGDGR